MLAFVLAVLLFNLFFMCLFFFIRHMIAIATPVLVMTALVAFFCTITFPYLAAFFDYGTLAVIFCMMILCFSVLLTLADKKFPAPAFSAADADHPSDQEEPPSKGLNLAAEKTAVEKTAVEKTVLVTAQDLEVVAQQLPQTPNPLETQPPEEMGETPPEKISQSTGLENEPELVHTATTAEDLEICNAGVAESDFFRIEPKQTDPNALINLGFDRKQNGDCLGAATFFFSVLQMQPEPKLAILLAMEISDIYRAAGQFWQAAEILNILLDSWRNELDTGKVARLEIKISQLHELLNKKGVKV